jgi:hypothetical protein
VLHAQTKRGETRLEILEIKHILKRYKRNPTKSPSAVILHPQTTPRVLIKLHPSNCTRVLYRKPKSHDRRAFKAVDIENLRSIQRSTARKVERAHEVASPRVGVIPGQRPRVVTAIRDPKDVEHRGIAAEAFDDRVVARTVVELECTSPGIAGDVAEGGHEIGLAVLVPNVEGGDARVAGRRWGLGGDVPERGLVAETAGLAFLEVGRGGESAEEEEGSGEDGRDEHCECCLM